MQVSQVINCTCAFSAQLCITFCSVLIHCSFQLFHVIMCVTVTYVYDDCVHVSAGSGTD